MPQGSVLRPILFNVFLSGNISRFSISLIALILNDFDFAIYADDNTLSKECENVNAVTKTLRISSKKLFSWFKDNQIKGNTDRFHLILSAGDSNQIQVRNSS